MAQIITIGEIVATEVSRTFLEPGLFASPYPSGAPVIFADRAARVGTSAAVIGSVGEDVVRPKKFLDLHPCGACDPYCPIHVRYCWRNRWAGWKHVPVREVGLPRSANMDKIWKIIL